MYKMYVEYISPEYNVLIWVFEYVMMMERT